VEQAAAQQAAATAWFGSKTEDLWREEKNVEKLKKEQELRGQTLTNRIHEEAAKVAQKVTEYQKKITPTLVTIKTKVTDPKESTKHKTKNLPALLALEKEVGDAGQAIQALIITCERTAKQMHMGNIDFDNDCGKITDAAAAAQMDGAEVDYLRQLLKSVGAKNLATYAQLMQQCAEINKSRETTIDKWRSTVKELMVLLIGSADSEKARTEATAKLHGDREKKIRKRKMLIYKMSRASLVDKQFDGDANIKKYLADATGLEKEVFKSRFPAAKHTAKGGVFMPHKGKPTSAWQQRFLLFDLRERKATIMTGAFDLNAGGKVEAEIPFNQVMMAKNFDHPKVGKREDGHAVVHTFVVMTDKTKFYFCALTQEELTLWVNLWQAVVKAE